MINFMREYWIGGGYQVKNMESFDYSLDFKTIDFRRHPELYRIGRGEQGAQLVEPYKSELLPHFQYRTPDLAQQSGEKIYALYLAYRDRGDFVGMDMARKYLQMGFSRARRYANHRPDRKPARDSREAVSPENSSAKPAAAEIFWEKWQQVLDDPVYQQRREYHRQQYEHQNRPAGGSRME